MAVTRSRAALNGLACRCPNCGGATLFVPGHPLRAAHACPTCGCLFRAGSGAYLGPFVINYGVTVAAVVVPVIALFAQGRIASSTALVAAGAAALLAPLALYRLSWGWWLALYYFFLPGNLPENLGDRPRDDT